MSKAADEPAVDDATPTDAIVIDAGSCLTKVGYSGEDSPRARFSTVVGLNTEKLESELNATNDGGNDGPDGAPDNPYSDEKLYYVGDEVIKRRSALNLSKPIHSTVVHDWDALEKVWEWSFAEELNVDPEAFPVLVTDSVLETKKSRETMAKIMFEKFNVKSFYVATQAVLSLFSSGLTSGMVVECGDDLSRAVPVFEGYAMRHAVSSTHLAVRNVYGHFGKALQAANPSHKLVVDALDLGCLANQLKELHCCVDINGPDIGPGPEEEAIHELPDGSVIHIPYSVCAGSAELLFTPDAAGIRGTKSIPGIVLESMRMCDNDLQNQFNKLITVSGGTAMISGFARRMQAELRKGEIPNVDMTQVRVSADSHLTDASWVGGSMFASLSTFNSMKIRKQEYDDAHAVIVHRKCL